MIKIFKGLPVKIKNSVQWSRGYYVAIANSEKPMKSRVLHINCEISFIHIGMGKKVSSYVISTRKYLLINFFPVLL